MRRVKGKDTAPELTVRKRSTRWAPRYRLHRKDLPGKPDIVLPGRRLAIFVHGCFWHGHDCARGARVPPKPTATTGWARSPATAPATCGTARRLAAAGWRVETVWECDLKDAAALQARARDWLAVNPNRVC